MLLVVASYLYHVAAGIGSVRAACLHFVYNLVELQTACTVSSLGEWYGYFDRSSVPLFPRD